MTTTAELKEQTQTILVVDDTPANLCLLVDHLEAHGFNVVIAQDGGEGVQRAQLVQPDLILLDVTMPGIDGFETCRRLKAEEKTRDIPIIFMTGLTQIETMMVGFEVGGVDYVTKPFQLDELLVRVKNHLALHALQKRLEAQNLQLQQEVAERKQAEASLKREQALLDTVMENIPDNVYFKDLQSRFTRINKAMVTWFGVSDPSQVMGKTDFDFFTFEHAQQALDDEQEIICTGQPLPGKEEKETWPDGRKTWVLTTKMPLRDNKGHIIGTMGISRDITARKQAEEQLRKYKNQLEAQVAARTAELTETNAQLQREIAEHKRAEEELARQRASIAEMYEQEQTSCKLAEQLQASAQVINSSLDLDIVLPTILDQLREVVDYDSASVQLLEGDAMRVIAVRGHSTAEVGQVRRLADFPYNLRLASNTEPIILEENSKNELWPQASEYAAVCSNIGVPLIVRHKIIGALTIDSHKPAQYAHQDAQAAMAFARQAAIAIENARLYSYSQQELAEQVQAEKALRQSQQNYEALVNTVDGIVWETDANFAFTFISKQAEHILGYPVERWLTEQNFWNEHIHPEDRTWAVNFCLEATKENKDHEFQYRMIAADGRVVWLHDFVTLIFENGKAAKLRGLMVDITERKQAEEASRKADERFRIICETVSEYIYDCRVEPDGQIIFETVSDNFVRIMGYTVEELKAHGGWHCLVHPDDRTSVEGLIKKLFARQQVHLEFRGITRSGETRWIRLYPYPIWDETEQRVTRVIGAGQDITERKEAEETLRINQELLQSVINNAGNVIFVKDTEGRYLLINKRFEELFHVSNEDILGKTDYDCFPKEQADLFRSNDMKALLAGAPVQSEEIVSQDDGLHTYIAIKCPLFDKTQKAYAICGIATDITGRLQAEEALIESEGCYRTLVEHAPEAIVILDVEKGRFVEANENGLRLYGLSKEELTKVGPIDMSPPVQPDGRPSLESALEKIRQAVAGETPVFEWMHRNAAGEDIPCEVRLVRFPVTGRILVRGSVTDITERKRAEETLHASEERYRSLFQDSPISLWEEDFSEVKNYIDGLRAAGVSDLRSYFMEHPEEVARCAELVNILQVNKTTVHLADGNSVEDFLAGLNRTFTDKTLEVFREEILALAEGNSTFEAESEALTLKGRKIFIALMLSILPGYEDSWSKVLVSVNDLTERKQAEEALRQSEEQLRQALKMEAVGRLAGGIAHDFNNMLLPIIGYSEILLEQLKQGDPLCHPIEEIKKAGERAAALTKQILAFSRKQVLQPHVLDLNVVVTDMDKMLQRLIGEDIELITKLHPSLWSVKVDPSQIEQVILNLAVNARDAMPNGGDLIIETENVYLDEEYAKNHESVQPGQYVMLAVSDTGCGMDAETQMNIFEPFFTTKERSKGTGLGLSTVYGIIKQSGGNIWVYSEIGHGTTFKIYLPRVIDETEVLKPALVSNETKEGAETILVVEDEEGVRHVLQDILKANGYHVLLAADGIEAVEICDRYENSIHLLITDMVLPQMGGREVAKRLTAARPKIKVIFISGYTENSIGYHGALDAAIPFLQKPFTATALLQKVRQVLKV